LLAEADHFVAILTFFFSEMGTPQSECPANLVIRQRGKSKTSRRPGAASEYGTHTLRRAAGQLKSVRSSLPCTRSGNVNTSTLVNVSPRAHLLRIAPWWIASIIIGSFLPGDSKAALGTKNPPAAIAEGRVAVQHRLVHFVSFGSTALILVLLSETPAQQIMAAVSVAGLGLTVEYAQYKLLNLPDMEWWDVRDDTLAALAFLALAQWRGLRQAIVGNGR